MQEIVYKIPGKNHGPAGKTYDWIAVNSEDDLKAKIKEGWFNTLDEAINYKPVSPRGARLRAREEDGQYKGDDPSTPDVNEAYEQPPTRAELKEKANDLDIKHPKNIASVKLLALVEEKLKG